MYVTNVHINNAFAGTKELTLPGPAGVFQYKAFS